MTEKGVGKKEGELKSDKHRMDAVHLAQNATGRRP